MDFLQAEIKRQQELTLKRSAAAQSKQGPTKSKYMKRSQLEEESRTTIATDAKRRRVDTPDKASTSALKEEEEEVNQKNISEAELVKRLRQRNEPIRLFGESMDERLKRLRKLEILQPEVEEGMRNEFRAAMDKVDEEHLQKLAKGKTSEITEEEMAKLQMRPDWSKIQEICKDVNKGSEDNDRAQIIKLFRHILDLWEATLFQRSDDVKRSLAGKNESGVQKQTAASLKPLFKGMRKNTIDYSISRFLAEIVEYISQREYSKATDAYLRMAIGKAQWPIGVTMVGIHERSAREKIFSQTVAHVLNDETKRKYIQAVKRLITVMQNIFPTDPSKSIEFMG